MDEQAKALAAYPDDDPMDRPLILLVGRSGKMMHDRRTRTTVADFSHPPALRLQR
ncbi:hypothetical protein ACTWPT_58735 [Nonomuraea sp. 3N208]|uniref:hypothetical protein n=1 Tax=Nonomuraea sp. 3N208 TaxID=3457421 RepID=UPI003FD0EC71